MLLLLWYLSAIPLLLLVPNVVYMLTPPSGDEPFYLVTAMSIARDGDIDETNNYEQRDYLDFAPSCDEMNGANWGTAYFDDSTANAPGIIVPGIRDYCDPHTLNGLRVAALLRQMDPPRPHAASGATRRGLYTEHGLGLSVIIAPFYELGGRPAVVMFLVGLGALVGVNAWLLAFEVSRSRMAAWVVWGLVQFSVPVVCHSFLVLPAIPAAVLVIYAYRQIRSSARDHVPCRGTFAALKMLLTGSALGLLSWLDGVYFALAGPLFGLCVALQWRKGTRQHWIPVLNVTLPFAALSGLLLYYHYFVYGTVLPDVRDHSVLLSLGRMPVNLLWMLIDQKHGLLPYAPAFLIPVIGCAHAVWKRATGGADDRSATVFQLMLLTAPYVLVVASNEEWWGQWCPPARRLVPILPLMAAPFALALTVYRNAHFRVGTTILGAMSLLISGSILSHPHLMYNSDTSDPATFFVWLCGKSAAALLPMLVRSSPHGHLLGDVVIPWACVGVFTAFVLSRGRSGRNAASTVLGRRNAAPAAQWPRWEWAALAAIAFLALGLRLWAVERIPSVLIPDECDNLRNVYEIINGHGPGFFGLDWKPQPAASVHLLSLAMRAGMSVFALRLPAAIFGTLTLIPFYLTLRRAVSAPAALLTTGLLAGDLWFLHFSRTGWENVNASLCLAAATLCIRSAVRRGRMRSFAVVGLWAAAGAYGYMAGRAVFPAVLIVGVLALIRPAIPRRRIVAGLFIASATTILLIAPQLHTIYFQWDNSQARVRAVYILGGSNESKPLLEQAKIVAANFGRKAHQMFLGDIPVDSNGVDREALRYLPREGGALAGPTTALLVVGMLLSILRSSETWIWWVMLLVSFATTQALTTGPFNGARGVIFVPTLYLFVGLSLQMVWQLCVRVHRPLVMLVVIAVAGLSISTTRHYFEWVSSAQVLDAFEPAVPIGKFHEWQAFLLKWTADQKGVFTVSMWKARNEDVQPAVIPSPTTESGVIAAPKQSGTGSTSQVRKTRKVRSAPRKRLAQP